MKAARLALVVNMLPLALLAGSISGQVRDAKGKPVENATVSALSANRDSAWGVTDIDGRFRLEPLSPGMYVVRAGKTDDSGIEWVNLDPTQGEAHANVSRDVRVTPRAATHGTGAPVFLVCLLALMAVFFAWYDRVNPIRLRVPILGLILWALLTVILAAIGSQDALIMLQAHDATWAGAAFGWSGFAIWMGRTAIRYSIPVRRRRRPDAAEVAIGVGYCLIVFVSGGAIAVKSINAGMPELQPSLFLGAIIVTVGSIVYGLLVDWIRQRRGWPRWRTSILAAGMYLALGLCTYLYTNSTRDAELMAGQALPGSPLTHLYGLVGTVTLALSLACVWLDRYRVPLLGIAGVVALLAVALGRGDYTFATRPQGVDQRLTPAQTIAGRERVIVVAVSGGGVQAAAWSARVLGELAKTQSDFAKHVRLLSSVSGGSVGAIHFLGTYPVELGGLGRPVERAMNGASEPMLETLLWALVGRDLPRSLLFLGHDGRDRGWVLDRTLAIRTGLGDTPMSALGSAVNRGLPAMLLNATEVETGRPVAFSTSKLKGKQLVDFSSDTGRDLEAVTAARLSATFPLVSPAARGDVPDKTLPHIADGGYYDNFGMFALMEWLDQALAGGARPKLLVIRIEAFPESAGATAVEPAAWPFQLGVPVATLASVRSAAQIRRNEAEFTRFAENYGRTGGEVSLALFRYAKPATCPDPPLSWDLTPREVDCVKQAWSLPEVQAAARQVSAFLQK